MKTFKLKYYFEGNGEVVIMAKNEKEAREKFFDGDYEMDDETEWGENYNIEEVEEIKE